MKRVLSLLICICLILSSLGSIGIYAAEAVPSVTLSCTDNAEAENQLIVTAVLADASDYCGFSFGITYDNTKLKPVSANVDPLFASTIMPNLNKAENQVYFSYTSANIVSSNGTVVSFVFEILDASTGNVEFDIVNLKMYDEQYSKVTINGIGTSHELPAPALPTVTLDVNESASSEGEIVVSATLANAVDYCGISFGIIYDNTKLTPLSAAAGDSFVSTVNPNLNKAENQVYFSYVSANVLSNNGKVVDFTFKVKNNVSGTADFSITNLKMYDASYSAITVENVGAQTEIICTHKNVEWVQTKAPKCDEKGLKEFACACGYYDSEEIDTLDHNYIATVVPPTALEGGYTKYVCDACGDEYIVADAFAAAIGEVKYTTLAAAIEAAAKGATIDLLADAEAVTVAKAVTINKNGFAAEITVDGTNYGMVETDDAYIVYPMIGSTSGASLLLKDMIQISYKSLPTNFTDKGFTQADILANGKLLVWTGDAVSADATYLLGTETETIDLTYDSGNKAYAGNADGIPARLMGDVQKYRFCITDADGVVWYSSVKEYSPKTYAINMYGKSTTSAKDKALVVALMNYGAAAQINFAYNTNDLMNSWLPEAEQNLYTGYTATELKADTESKFAYPSTTAIVKAFGKSAVLKGAIEINVKLQLQTAYKNADLTLLYWTEDAYNSVATLTEANATGSLVFDKSGTYPEANINGIPARLLGDTVFFCVKAELNGNVSYSPLQTYSIHQYCVNTIGKASNTEAVKNLAAAILVYSNKAETALGK